MEQGYCQLKEEGGGGGGGGGGGMVALANAQIHSLKWQAHMLHTWHRLCDGTLQDM